MYPLGEASGGQEQYYARSAWHSEEWNWECSGQSVLTPHRGIWWPRTVICKIILTFWRMQLRMQWTVSVDPPGRGIWWSWAVLNKVSLTFLFLECNWEGILQSDVPPHYRHLVVKISNMSTWHSAQCNWEGTAHEIWALEHSGIYVDWSVVVVVVTAECCCSCCSSVIVEHQLQLNKNNNNIT